MKNQFFLLLHTACISLALPLSLLPFTRDTHVDCLQWNVFQFVQTWIFNIANTDSFTQTLYLWYKYYSKWICVSFSFQYMKIAINLWQNEMWSIHFEYKRIIITRIEPVGKPDREVALLSWNEMFRMPTYQNDLWNILKNVCKESKFKL